jgi:hypothetical protein
VKWIYFSGLEGIITFGFKEKQAFLKSRISVYTVTAIDWTWYPRFDFKALEFPIPSFDGPVTKKRYPSKG